MWSVVVNQDEQYSIWLTKSTTPDGWSGTGYTGTRDQCLDHIVSVWSDLTPADVVGGAAPAVLPQKGEREGLSFLDGVRKPLPAPDLVSMIERQVHRVPQSIAVREGERSISYRELDRAAERIALRLVGAGLTPGAVAAVSMRPGVDLLTTLLAVLKTGAAYLPIDPGLPADRVSYMLSDARPVIAVSDAEHAPFLEALADCPVIRAAAEDAEGGQGDGVEAADAVSLPRPGARSLAYVIYTSGSTGRPKGVMVEHLSLVNYLDWAVSAYPSLATSALLHSPLSFDLTVTALYGPLVSGGCVEIAQLPTGTSQVAAEALPPVGFLKGTPSHLPILTVMEAERLPEGDLVLGGEALLCEHVMAWRGRNPGVTVVNEYGPTETTVGCSWYRMGPEDPVPAGVITLGDPISNCRMYVLDDDLRMLPHGETGELYIGGLVVARGYLGRPDLTAGAFLPDPHADLPGARMYRTGDMARLHADGTLEFRGRRDQQVKLRGYRIELGEIESVLLGHPEVSEAVATLNEKGTALLAYVASATLTGLTETLRDRLRSRLPDYMVPDRIVRVAEIPRTANGKTDLTLLARLGDDGDDAVGDPESMGGLERSVARVWADLLGVRAPGHDENFFDLGGNSLLAAQIIRRLRTDTGRAVPLAALYTNPTISGLARVMEKHEVRAQV